jgi:UDP-glucose 4-epimerase
MNLSHVKESTQLGGQFPRILLTGATGFLGSILLINLEKLGFEIYSIPRLDEFSIGQTNAVPSGRDLVLINCMGVTSGEKSYTVEQYMQGNVNSLHLVFDQLGTQIKKFVHCSTWLTEGNEESDYTVSKIQAEEVVTEAARSYGFEVVILRLPTIWSKKKYKKTSLIHDLFKFEFAFSEFEPKNRNAEIHIGTEEFFVGCVMNSILSKFSSDWSRNSEVWHGTVGLLIEELSLYESQGGNHNNHVIEKLSQIIKHWRMAI